MKITQCFIAIILFTTFIAVFPKSVVKLTQENFDKTISENDHVLVKFYAPWCGHCKSMAPKYENAAKALAKKGSKVVLAEIDATKEEEIAQNYEIEGFPTIKLFRNGNPEDYNNGRETDDFIEFCENVNLPTTVELNDEEAVKKFIEDAGASLILFLNDAESSSDNTKKQAFMEVAREFKDEYPFGIVEDKKILQKYGKEMKYETFKSFILLSTDFGGSKYAFDKDFEKENIALFLNVYALPLVPTWNEKTANSIFRRGEYFLFSFRNSDESQEEKHYEITRKRMEPLAALHRPKIASGDLTGVTFIDVNVKGNPEGEDLAKFFEIDVENSKFPLYRGIKMSQEGAIDRFLPPAGGLNNPEDMQSFIDDFTSGKLKAVLKSEAVPTDNDENNVKVLVGDTFNKWVNKKGKDVLVKFYAPWCGHCKAMAPTYEKLGEIFADVDHVVIGKIDATMNDFRYDGVDIQGFPTLYLFSDAAAADNDDDNIPVDDDKKESGKKKVTLFDKDRTLKGMLEFLSTNAQKYELSQKALDIIAAHGDEEETPSDIEDVDEVVDETNVAVLSSETFKSTIAENEFVLVEFFAPWCGHCKALKPEYAAAADILKDSNPNVIVAKIDATANEKIAQKYEVQGYPTFKFFKNGTASDFHGGRDVQSIVNYVKTNLRPTLTIIDDMDVMDNFLSQAEGTNILFSSFGEDSTSKSVEKFFKSAALSDQLTSYAIVPRENNKDVISYVENAYNIQFESSQLSYVFFASLNTKTNDNDVFEMDLMNVKGPEDFMSFTSIVRLPTVTVWNEMQAEALFSGLQEDFLFGFVKTLDGSSLYEEMKDICPRLRKFDMKRKFACVIVEYTDENKDMMEFFQVNEESLLPTYRGVHLGTSDTEEVSMFPADEGSDIYKYVHDIIDGKIQKMEMPENNGGAEEEEADDPNSNVVVLTPDNWDSVVMNSNKDVLVEFYAPWCGHCKQLKPIYELVANDFVENEFVTIAKINADKHEIPGIEIEGFPTIKLFKHSDKKKPIEYEGMGRSKLDIIKFVNENGDEGIELSEKNEL